MTLERCLLAVLAAALVLAPQALATTEAEITAPDNGATFYTGTAGPDSTHLANYSVAAHLTEAGCTSGTWNIERATAGQGNWASITGYTIQDANDLQAVEHMEFAGDYEYRATVSCAGSEVVYSSPVVLVHVAYGLDPACKDARAALKKARATLRRLQEQHAGKQRIHRAKRRVAARKVAVAANC